MTRYVGFVDGKKGAHGVVIPDFPGCHGGGKTPDKAIADATSCLTEFAEIMLSDCEKLPKPRSLEKAIAAYRDITKADEDYVIVYIPLILDAGRNVKVNLSIDQGILQAIDAEAKRRGLTRSAFLASAARDKIEQAG